MATISDLLNKFKSGEYLEEIKAKAIKDIKKKSQSYICPIHSQSPVIDESRSDKNEIRYTFCCNELKNIFSQNH